LEGCCIIDSVCKKLNEVFFERLEKINAILATQVEGFIYSSDGNIKTVTFSGLLVYINEQDEEPEPETEEELIKLIYTNTIKTLTLIGRCLQ